MRKTEEKPLCNKILYQYLLIIIFLFFSCNPTVTDDKTEWNNIQTVPITCDDFLKVDGKVLRKKKGSGDIVFLKGVNAGGYLLQEFWMTPTEYSSNVKAEIDLHKTLAKRFGEKSMFALVKLYQDNYWKRKDFDNCAKLGMNVIRLPFWYMNFVDTKGNLKSECFDKLDWFIKEAGSRGLYVILDFHGAPGSQNGSDHSGIDGGDNKEKASEFFFGKNASANQKMYYMIWEKIANRYKENPIVAGYDLLNEPYCTYRYNSSYSVQYLHSLLWNIYDTAYKKIRAIDPDHIIIMSATWDPGDLPDPNDYQWINVMYQYHNYLYDDYDNSKGNQIYNMEKKLNLIAQANYNVPSYMGEFNYFKNLDAWSKGLDLLNNSGINWTIWTYKAVSEHGNWGLYNQQIPSTNCETDSYEQIYNNWSKVGSSYPNTQLIDTVKWFFRPKQY